MEGSGYAALGTESWCFVTGFLAIYGCIQYGLHGISPKPSTSTDPNHISPKPQALNPQPLFFKFTRQHIALSYRGFEGYPVVDGTGEGAGFLGQDPALFSVP